MNGFHFLLPTCAEKIINSFLGVSALMRSSLVSASHHCFATHPSPWSFQLVPANDCDLFNFACDEGPSNSPQSLLERRKKVASESNVVAMATFWQPPRCTKSPHNEEHWLFPTSSLHRRGGAAHKQQEVSPPPNQGWGLEKEQEKCTATHNAAECWACLVQTERLYEFVSLQERYMSSSTLITRQLVCNEVLDVQGSVYVLHLYYLRAKHVWRPSKCEIANSRSVPLQMNGVLCETCQASEVKGPLVSNTHLHSYSDRPSCSKSSICSQ